MTQRRRWQQLWQSGRRLAHSVARPAIIVGLALAIAFALTAIVPSESVFLGDRSVQAPIVFDGRVLFPIRQSADLSAPERAEAIGSALTARLDRYLEAEEPSLEVSAGERNSQVVVDIDGDQLLTVTERDAADATTPQGQAIQWSRQIEDAFERAREERTTAYRKQAALKAALALVLAAIAGRLLTWLTAVGFRRLEQSGVEYERWPSPLPSLLRLRFLIPQTLLWLGVGWYVTGLFPRLRVLRYELFVVSVIEPVFQLGEREYAVLDAVTLLGSLVVLWLLSQTLARLLKTRVLAQAGADRGVQEAVGVLVQYGLTFLGFVVLLQAWGLDVGSLAIAASVLGVGIGLGLQNIANNFVSGLVVILERPIQVGDFVAVDDLTGTVERIGARSTHIRTIDGVTIVVPNSRFLENKVVNWSHGDPMSRLTVPVGVAYGTDANRVRSVLLEAARGCPLVLDKPPPQVWFREFGDSSLNFDVLVWIGEPRQQFYIRSELNFRINDYLRRYHIEIPFPQRDLHLRSPEIERLVRHLTPPPPPSSPTLYAEDGHPLSRNAGGSAPERARRATDRSGELPPESPDVRAASPQENRNGKPPEPTGELNGWL